MMFFKFIFLNELSLFFLILGWFVTSSNFEFIQCTNTDQNSFENVKNEFMKGLTKFKLENYLRKVKMKNLGILDDAFKQNFYFIDPTEKQLMMLNNLKKEDIYSEDFEDENENEKNENLGNNVNTETKNDSKLEREKYKARIFAYLNGNLRNEENFENSEKIEKNSKNEYGKSLKEKSKTFYRVLGVNLDEEKKENWKIFLVLLNSYNSTSENKNQKLIKVCFPDNQFKLNFAIILNFDKPCTDLIDQITGHKILSEDHNTNTISNKLHSIQGEILTNKVCHKKENLEDYNKSKSFLEKSSQSEEKEEKNYSIDYLAQKFSVDELNKIKFLIKFAKKNEIIDIISSNKGDLNLSDLITQHKIKKKNFVRPFSNLNMNLNLNTNDLSEKNPNSTTIIKIMANEIYDLKTIVMNQNTQMEILFDEMKRKMDEMKNFMGKKGENIKSVQNNEKVNEKKEEKFKMDDNLQDINKIGDLFGYHDGTEGNPKGNNQVNSSSNSHVNNGNNGINNNLINGNGNNIQMYDNGSNMPMNMSNMGNNIQMNLNNMNMGNMPMNPIKNMNTNIPMNNMQMNMNGNMPMNNMQMNMSGNMALNNMPLNNVKMNMNNSQNLRFVNNNNYSPNNYSTNQQIPQSSLKFKETDPAFNTKPNANNFTHSIANSSTDNIIKRAKPPHNLTLMRKNGKPLSPFLTASNLHSLQDDDDLLEKNIKHDPFSSEKYVDP